ncbi:MAG: CARDB domain-containing protein, partial [Novosphingobium sp.]
PLGQVVFGSSVLSSTGLLTATMAGSYTLLVEGRVSRSADSAYNFVFDVASQPPANGATAQDFEAAGGGLPFVLGNHQGLASQVLDEGGNRFVRLTEALNPNSHNSVYFSATGSGRQDAVDLSFDFRIARRAGQETDPDGIAFTWLPVSLYGAGGLGPTPPRSGSSGLEPNLAGALGIGFDSFANNGEVNANHVSIHYNGVKLADIAVPGVTLANGDWTRARILLSRTAGGTLLTIHLTEDGGSAVTVVSDYFIGGMELEAGRVLLSASQGTSTGDQDIDKLSVAMTAAAAPMQPLTPGETVSGAVDRAGAVYRYQFTVTEPTPMVFDALTNNAQLRWQISGPTQTGAAQSFTASDSTGFSGNPVKLLQPGSYEVAIWGNAGSTGSYAFRLLPLAGATALTLDESQSVTLASGNDTKLFSFDAEAGERLYFDHVSGSTNPYWRLIDPKGNLVFAGTMGDVAEPMLEFAGRYTLLIEGRIATTTPQTLDFRVSRMAERTAALTLGETASGAIALPGDRTRYSFSLERDALLLFDSLTNRGDLGWSLSGPLGIVESRDFSRSDAFNRNDATPFFAMAGAYVLTVYGAGQAVGDYAFRLADIATATPLVLDAVTSGTLEPANSTQLYKFAGVAGDRLFFDYLTNGTSGTWRLIDPHGRLTFNANHDTDVGPVTLEKTGVYTLLFEGRVDDAGASGAYQFKVSRLVDKPAALTLGETFTGALDQPQQEALLSFTLTEPTLLYVDALTADGALIWSLVGPHGDVASRSFTATDGYNFTDNPVMAVAAGSYTLKVRNNSTTDRSFSVRVLDLASSTVLTPGLPVTGTLSPGAETEAWRFEGKAGERYYFDRQALAGGLSPYWRLIGPGGQQLFAGGFNDVETFELPENGTYTLLLEGYIHDAGTLGTYGFNVFANPVAAPIDISLEPIPGPDLVVRDVAVSAEGAIRSGGTVTVAWKTRNSGTLPAAGPWTDRVIVRNLDTNQIIGNFVVEDAGGDLAAGAERARQFTLTLPTGNAGTGRLSFTVTADTANAVVETNASGTAEINNNGAVEVVSTLAPFIDLTVSDVAATPAGGGWAPGDTVTLNWTTTNSGNQATPAGFTERVVVRNVTSNQQIVLANVAMGGVLAAGEARARSHSIVWPEGLAAHGQFTFTVTTDILDAIVEANDAGTGETNNSAAATVFSAPDLTVRNLAITTPNAAAGDTVSLTWDEVNIGNANTLAGWNNRIIVYNVTTGETLLDTSLTSDTLLAAGAQRARSFSFALPHGQRSVGTIRVSVIADQGAGGVPGTVREAANGHNAESNNRQDANIPVAARDYPDLRVSDVTAPATAVGGGTITVNWRVTNIGGVAAAAGGGWIDRVVLSADATLGNADDIVLGEYPRGAALGAGGVYDGTLTVTLPDNIGGDYRLFVIADAAQAVAEPDTRADNIGGPALVRITSTAPNLVADAVFGPAGVVTGGELFTVSWRVRNTGDAAAAGGHIDRLILSADGVADAGDLVLTEVVRANSLAVGESYTVTAQVRVQDGRAGDYRLILVTDAGQTVFENFLESDNAAVSTPVRFVTAPAANLVVESVSVPAGAVPGETVNVTYVVRNTGTVTASAPWTDRLYIDSDTTVAGAAFLAAVPRSFDLAPGLAYEVTQAVTIPTGYVDGAWRILVRADALGQVFEGGQEADNDAASGILTLTHPDLVPVAVEGPDGGVASNSEIQIRWQVRNNGTGGTLGGWTDTVWLSRDDVVGAGDIKLGEVASGAALAAGGVYDGLLNVRLPIDASGEYRIIVQTDSSGAVAETAAGEGNNVAAVPLSADLAPYADLKVSNVQAPSPTIDDPARITVTWRVTNDGTGAGITSSWTDRVIVSRDAIYGNGDDIVLGELVHSGALAVGESYDASLNLILPAGFHGRYTLFVQADARDEVFENGEDANRGIRAGHFDVSPIPWADLYVASVTTPTTAMSGTRIDVSWRVGNQGIGLTNSGEWNDQVYLERTDGTGRVKLGSVNHLGFLAAGQSYDRTASFVLPNGLEGEYRIVVETPGSSNPLSGPYEFVFTDNNRGVSAPFLVALSPSPDLVVEAISAPATGVEGQVIDVEWTVRNAGLASAEGTWIDRVYLRKTGDTGAGTLIGTYSYTGPLEAGKTYSRREEMRLPIHSSDRYEVIVVTDAANSVYEHGAEDNNRSIDDQAILVSVLPRPDLRVSEIIGPDRVSAGATASIEFKVINQGLAAANGVWTDQVWLSLDDKLTSDDILVSSLQNGAALGSLEEYLSSSATFTIPKRFRGTVYVLVATDTGNAIDEWPNDTTLSNVTAHELYVDPIPFADLVVDNVVVPAQAFEGNAISVRYTVTNRGAGDTDLGRWTEQVWLTRDKNRPHPGQGDILLTTLTYNDGILLKDAGYDRELTVTLPDGLVSGTYYIMPWVDPYATLLEDSLATNVNPDDPAEINSSNYRARAIDIVGVPPLTYTRAIAVEGVTADPTGLGGEPFTVSWTVKANGNSTATKWTDTVYLADAPLFENATNFFTLGSFANLKPLDPGQSYTNTQTFTLNPAAAGMYVIVRSQLAGDPNVLDNQAFAATSVTNTPADLRVVNVTPAAPATPAYSGEMTSVTYTVENRGGALWAGTQYWKDEVWISKDPVFAVNRATKVGTTLITNGPLGAGGSYSRTVDFTMPPGVDGEYYVYVFTNVASNNPAGGVLPVSGSNAGLIGQFAKRAFELPQGNMGQAQFPVVYREPDLKVTELTLPDTLAAGSTVTITFKVENVGNRATREDRWTDRVYLSLDASLDEGDWLMSRESSPGVIVKAEHNRVGVLEAGDYYYATVTVTLPFELQGPMHVIAMADSALADSFGAQSTLSPRLAGVRGALAGKVREFQGEGNNSTARQVALTPYSPPNLQVTALGVPERVVRGQKFRVEYTVTNSGGTTPALQGQWDDLIYLSRDPFLDLTSDRYIGSVRHSGGLLAGDSYDVALDLVVPSDLGTEAYYVFVVTDPARYNATGAVYEANERDNARASTLPMVIELPPPTDVQVVDITVPDNKEPGDLVTINWTVRNTSAVMASGSWSDAVYLSRDATWDVNDRLLGYGNFTGTLLPDGTYTLSLNTTLPGASAGEYRVIVRADVRNQLHEDVGEGNNTTASPDALSISVPELKLGIPLTADLAPGQERLYRIEVPADRTLRLRVGANDERSINEVFLRHDLVPTSAAFDATYVGPLSQELTAIVPGTEPGVYYVLLRGYSGPSDGAQVTLIADLLPLVITGITTDRGGDSRFVTTTIKGAQFHPNAIVKVSRPNIAEYEPVTWEVVDSSTIIAKFDFTGAPHGLYDIKVINPDGSETIEPYRFLIERGIEPEVTIGIGGPRVILAGDQATYSAALENQSNLDAPYTYFQVGIPELNSNQYVYGLRFLDFFTNVRGAPEGTVDSLNTLIPWLNLESIVNTHGQLITSGFLYDHPADGFAGFTFNIQTYPGLKAMADRSFEAFREQMAVSFPSLDDHLAGGEGGLENWWEAVKDHVSEQLPAARGVLDQLDFVGLYKANTAVPSEDEIPFIPFRFHILASATTMTRAEFVAFQTAEALSLRAAILAAADAPAPLLALAASETDWVNLYLAALEDAGLLRPEGDVPPIRTQQHIVSLMTTLASGILYGPAGSAIRSNGDILGFFEQVRTLYGHTSGQMAAIEFMDPRQSPRYIGEVPIPALPDRAAYDLGLSTPTHFEAFRIFVPWLDFAQRGAGLPADFQINGPEPVDGDPFASLDFSRFYQAGGEVNRLASITGPQTMDTLGWLPNGASLPYTIGFENAAGSSRYTNEIRIVTQIDPALDPRSFSFGDIRIGDITIDVPDGRSSFQAEYDFVATRGFILRVSAVLDLYQSPASATWLLQAIDPITGEVLQDATRGLLAPNNASGAGAGFVSYAVRANDEIATGERISASARVLMDGFAPEDTLVLSQMVDAAAPESRIGATRIGATNDFLVDWSVLDDHGGSGVRHVTLYVAEDGGDFRIWQRMLPDVSGSLVFEGEAGKTYEFLALATDVAGNREAPKPGVNATDDGSGVNIGALPTVPGTTPPNFGQPPAPSPVPSTNALFTAAEANVPAAAPLSTPSEFASVLSPFVARAFATGIGQSDGGIGPMAIVETPDGDFLISGGANRGTIWKFDALGGAAGTPFAELDEPVFNMAFDGEGRLWATTGGGALLELDPQIGAVIGRYGDGITIALAVHPATGDIYVSTNAGISIFNPGDGSFTQWSRDENLRVGSLAFDGEGRLWAVTWPDRKQVVRFTDRARAETMLTFDAPADSIAFGRPGTRLEGLLFVSHTAGTVADTGLAGAGSDLTMVDIATLRRIAVASSGSRGDVVHATSDGRLLISQSNQVDVVAPATMPVVVATNPPGGSQAVLPMPFLTVTFDQDMFAGTATDAGSVINPDYYQLVDGAGRVQSLRSITYDAATRTAVIGVGTLLAGDYALTIKAGVVAATGQRMGVNFESRFAAFDDISMLVDIRFSDTRMDRLTGIISYKVTITNRTDGPITLPALLTIDPLAGFPGVPINAAGQSDDGRWLIDMAASLPPGGVLEAGESASGRTVSITAQDARRLEFVTGLVGGTLPNTAPAFTSEPPAGAKVGREFTYQVTATDGEGQTIAFGLLTRPEGMTIDPATGLIRWVPGPGTPARTAVVVEAFDSRGAVSLQRFILAVEDGNSAPEFRNPPVRLEGAEGQLFEFQLSAIDADLEPLTYWVDGLPAGASFDPATRLFSWLADYQSAGTYDVRFFVTDGISRDEAIVTLAVADRNQPPRVIPVADRTAREGDFIRFRINASADSNLPLTYSSSSLPFGATLNPNTGEFEWTPSYIQNGEYEILFEVSDGQTTVGFTTKINVLNANGAPVFDQLDGWQVLEGQLLAFNTFAFDPDNPYYTPALRDMETGAAVATTNLPRTVTVELLSALPPGATFDPETLEFRWTPTNEQAGVYELRLRATDVGDGDEPPLSTEILVPIQVFNQNRRPEVRAIENVSVARDAVIEIPVFASDPDGNPLVLGLMNESPFRPVPSFITLVDHGDGTGVLRIAPGANDRGDHAIIVTALDDGDGTGAPLASGYVFIVTVTSPNEAPVLGHIGNFVAVAGQKLSAIIDVRDMDEDALTYVVDGLSGATITPTTVYGQALLEWTPTIAQIGAYDASVTVTDSGSGLVAPASASQAFRVVVRAANTAPQLAPVGNQAVREGEELVFDLRGLDADGDDLSFTMIGNLPGATLDAVTGTFRWTPALNAAGSYQISFTASDGHSSDSETVTFTVTNANQTPEFLPMATQLLREGTASSFTVIAVDGDGDPLSLSVVSGLPEGALFIPARGELQWTPGYDQAGDHVIRFAAVDPSGAVGLVDVNVRVANVNRAPTISEGYHAFLIGEEKRFLIAASDPDHDDTLTFSAENLPEGATVNAATGEFVWTPGPGQAGDYVVTLIVDDGRAVARRSVIMRAQLEPATPTLRIVATPSFPPTPGQNVLLHPIADSLSNIVSLRLWVDGREIPLDANGRASVTAGAPGKYLVRATVVDADGGTNTVEEWLKVRDPADKAMPAVSFAGGMDGLVVRDVLAIEGVIADSNLDYWTLTLIGADGCIHELARGDEVAAATLATLDGKTLRDGFYTLRLTGRDISGRTSVANARIEVRTGLEKTGRYQSSHIDVSAQLGAVPFNLARAYDSLTGEWIFLGLDVDLETSGPSQPGFGGALSGFELGTRVVLTLPTGERAGFTFRPVAETIGGVTFHRPAWVADQANGWTLQSVDAQLRKIGGSYFDVDTGLAYNPAAAAFGDRDYMLTGPDGTVYGIDSARGTVEIRSASGLLLIGDGGVTALGGVGLQFLRDAQGRVSQVSGPGGLSVVYEYDVAGNLSAMRDLSTGAGVRYGYSDGRLAIEIPSEGAGRRIGYGPDGRVTTASVRADLGAAATFTGQPFGGTLTAGAHDSYAFTVRESELAGLAGRALILRVATTGDVIPDIRGAQMLASSITGGGRVTLFAVREAGLYELGIAGAGAYQVEMRVAGDINGDGKVDGADSALVAAALAGSDIDGDGVTNATDRQLVAANYGFTANQAPKLAAVMPDVLTHVDLPTWLDLGAVASDPDGDRVYFRILEATGGTATLTANGRGLIFTPTSGLSGTAMVRVAADDGYGSSATGVIDIAISDAPLTAIDFEIDRPSFSDPGLDLTVGLIGTFADQSGVYLPYSYVQATVGDGSVIGLSNNGSMLALKDGATHLKVSRGNVAAATTVTVGYPKTGLEIMTATFDIDAYPDSVTLLPTGGTRQIITSMDPNREFFANGAAEGTVYISHDSSIVTVDADGLMRAVGEGSTFVTVINRWGQDRIRVTVAPAVIGDNVTIDGAAGGIVQNSDGVQIAFGPGGLTGQATVTIDTLTEAELAIPMVGGDTGLFGFLGAFDLQVDGAGFNDTVQIAYPVGAAAGQPGDQVWFFTNVMLPIGENGEEVEVWTVIDSGTIDADGMARVKSPPFPGLSKRGQVLIASAAVPLPQYNLNVGYATAITIAFAPMIGIAAVGGLAGAVTALGLAGAMMGMITLPMSLGAAEVDLYRKYAGMGDEIKKVKLNLEVSAAELNKTIYVDFPFTEAQNQEGPVLVGKGHTLLADGRSQVELIARNLLPDGVNAEHVKVILRHGTQELELRYGEFEISAGPFAGETSIKFTTPQHVLLGATEIFIERPRAGYFVSGDRTPLADTAYVSSAAVKIDNKAAYAFAGDATGVQVIDRALQSDAGGVVDRLIHRIDLGAAVKEIVTTNDLGAVFVATDKGIAVIDALSLRQFDANPAIDGTNLIPVPGGAVTALAVDTGNRYLYAAALGKIYVINIDPGKPNYLKVLPYGSNAITVEVKSGSDMFGHVTSMALNADGTRLYVGVPVSEMFGARAWVNGQNGDPGFVMVINTNEGDRPTAGTPNTSKWREVIAKIPAGIEVFDIQPTVDPNVMVFVSRGDRNRGVKVVSERDHSTPTGFVYDIKEISTQITDRDTGVEYAPFSIGGVVLSVDKKRTTDDAAFSLGKVNDLNVHNASGIAVTPDKQWMFVADWGVPTLYWFNNNSTARNGRIVGSTYEPSLAEDIDSLYTIGSKIMVIHDPFGTPTLVGSTAAIPMAFLEELRVDSSGKKLYANYRGAGNIVVIDIDEIRELSFTGLDEGKYKNTTIDNPNYGRDIYEEPVDVTRHGRGLALQDVRAITLISPLIEFDLFNQNAELLSFTWELDFDLLPDDAGMLTRFYLSALPPGKGLWPKDSPVARHWFDSDPDAALLEGDHNPNRIFTSKDMTPGVWHVDATGELTRTGDTDGKTFKVFFAAEYARAMTAGQEYYWGVELAGHDVRESASFRVP